MTNIVCHFLAVILGGISGRIGKKIIFKPISAMSRTAFNLMKPFAFSMLRSWQVRGVLRVRFKMASLSRVFLSSHAQLAPKDT